MNWLRFFDALARGERLAVRGLLVWIAVVFAAVLLLILAGLLGAGHL